MSKYHIDDLFTFLSAYDYDSDDTVWQAKMLHDGAYDFLEAYALVVSEANASRVVIEYTTHKEKQE